MIVRHIVEISEDDDMTYHFYYLTTTRNTAEKCLRMRQFYCDWLDESNESGFQACLFCNMVVKRNTSHKLCAFGVKLLANQRSYELKNKK